MKEILLLLVMFWNVENYFDTYDNPSTSDEEFTPTGDNRWSWKRFEKKRDDIAKTLLLAADEYGEMPGIIGLAEVENRFVLQQLLEETPLARGGYRYIHKDSPDSRGIDVALLYRGEKFRPLETKYIEASFPTRDVLYTKGVADGKDTLHIMVNHWPSKRGNESSSGKKREYVSLMVSRTVDSILNCSPDANIILMGDFNDTPDSGPLQNLGQLTNLAQKAKGAEGTYKYQHEWSIIDQILVSENMIGHTGKKMEIFAPEALFSEDATYMGIKPKRTYSGPRYLGGVSDHLPVLIKVFAKGN
ncbi:MAG: endonuclease/exonuclease/phosphatase family protein [Bacteroidales bacterium]|nr:endonuclease/exonuclease/phosphatase family protein [Bacteroidales bacterium]